MKYKIITISFVFLFSSNLQANNSADTIAEGGRMYDKWWKELGLDKPTTSHPSYPAASKKQGASSWRCKECHGWDYKGSNGAYGKGSHFTGIKGINSAKNKSINEIVSILKDNIHNYDNFIPLSDLNKIALFIKHGQVNINKYIEKKSKRVNGDLNQGKNTYLNSCEKCHGNDGRAINFRTKNKPEYVGTVAQHNPWEAIHKIRNGQPHTAMPNMNKKLDIKEQINLLTYLQSLPEK